MARIELLGAKSLSVKESIEDVIKIIDNNYAPKKEYIKLTGYMPEYDYEYDVYVFVSKITLIDSL